MYLKKSKRNKDGKTHEYWSVCEKYKTGNRKYAQRQILYLGELSNAQEQSWQHAIEELSACPKAKQLSLFNKEYPVSKEELANIPVNLSELRLRNLRDYGDCWLTLRLWEQLRLDSFFKGRLPNSRQGTSWSDVLKLLTTYSLLSPGSEWRLHRHWHKRTAMQELLGSAGAGISVKNTLYRCLDKLCEHKEELFKFLKERWTDLFNPSYEVLLYDLTNTHFECATYRYAKDKEDKRKFGRNKQKRTDCVQVAIGLIVTPEGFPLGYEVLRGNTSDSKTLKSFLSKIEKLYGKADRVWLMDRGIPTDSVLEEMRSSEPPISYLVGTPRSKLSALEQGFLEKNWEHVNDNIKVKLAESQGETFVLTNSKGRKKKENSMLMRELRVYWKTLKKLQVRKFRSSNFEKELNDKLVVARHVAGRAKYFVNVELCDTPVMVKVAGGGFQIVRGNFKFSLDMKAFRRRLLSDGMYLLRTNLTGETPVELWRKYVLLTNIEDAFKDLKSTLKIRPIFHSLEKRIEGHIFVTFLAYCLLVTLKNLLKRRACGLTPKEALLKLGDVKMVDVIIPTLDERVLHFARYIEPENDVRLILHQLGLQLPKQTPPKIYDKDVNNNLRT